MAQSGSDAGATGGGAPPAPRFLRAARRQPVDATPVWFMRQAGRALPEYRALRQRYAMLEIARTPELAVEASLQPVRRLGVDAAIVFGDIMLPAAGIGVPFDIKEGVGPVVERPVRTRPDVEALHPLEPARDVPFVARAVAQLAAAVPAGVPVIGFAGAPFTLASYLVEGRPTRTFATVKAMMYAEPALWHELMRRVAAATVAYLRAQAEAGAAALQLFDSWAGALSPADYLEFVQPHTRAVFAGVADLGVPLIHFGTGTAALLPLMAADGGTVIGLDWRVPLDRGWAAVGDGVAVQGNLDPAALLGPPAYWRRRAREVLRAAAGRRGHIFNLGHGVLPGTPVAHLQQLVEMVHAFDADEEVDP